MQLLTVGGFHILQWVYVFILVCCSQKILRFNSPNIQDRRLAIELLCLQCYTHKIMWNGYRFGRDEPE